MRGPCSFLPVFSHLPRGSSKTLATMGVQSYVAAALGTACAFAAFPTHVPLSACSPPNMLGIHGALEAGSAV